MSVSASVRIVESWESPRSEVTVRQTGALAYALLRLVDERIGEQQQRVFEAAGSMKQTELDKLPEVEVGV